MNRTLTFFSDEERRTWAGIIDEYNTRVERSLQELRARHPDRRI